MRGGLIHIRGSAGNCAGGAYRGSRKGMTGGELLIEGKAGDETGRVMRRGLIAIGGSSGEFCGSRMIAGSIFVGGTVGGRAGAGMKRGTICLLGRPAPELLPTFERAGVSRPVFLAAYARRLKAAGLNSGMAALSGPLERWCGDRLTGGLGEILTPARSG
jgi:formylmethanofuran dehydrogenase subunit C